MKYVHVRVNGDIAKIVKQDEIVRGSNNYVCIRFMFDSAWIDKNKVVELSDVEGSSYNTVIRKSNCVVLPDEITQTSRIYLRVHGRNKGKLPQQMIVTNEVAIIQI